MFKHGGVYLPDGETHLVEWMDKRNQRVDGKLTYQYHKLRAALDLTQRRSVCVDVGAHCGLWAMWLAREFRTVLCFEPVPEHVDCLMANTDGLHNVRIYEYALSDINGRTEMHRESSSSGDTYPEPYCLTGSVIMRAYDDLGIDERVDLVKLDCEGYELFALRGMVHMIDRDHPTIVVEQKPGRAQKYGLGQCDAVTWLMGRGYSLLREISGDYYLRWAA